MRKFAQIICYVPFLALGDAVFINAAFVATFSLASGAGTIGVNPHVTSYLYSLPILCIASFSCLFAVGLYSNWLHKTSARLALQVFAGVCLLGMSATAIMFWERHFELPRTVMPLSMVLQAILLLSYRKVAQLLQRKFVGPKRVLVIGRDEKAVFALIANLKHHGSSWFQVIGFLPEHCAGELRLWLPTIDVVAITSEVGVRDELLTQCCRNNKQVLLIPKMFDVLLHSAQPETVRDTLMFSVRLSSLTLGQLLIKRIVDLVGSAGMLLIASPGMLLLSILIPLTSRGNAIYKQERVGRYGTTFHIYKFRTMVSGAENQTGPTLASEFDSRVTPLGRLLRSTRLDELPQLINVIRGEMSLVGPRPERPFFVAQFEQKIPNYALRLQVKPGLTGLAQVKGRYNTTALRKLDFDLLYIFNYSFLSDLKILLETFRVVFKPEHATGVHSIPIDLSSEVESLLATHFRFGSVGASKADDAGTPSEILTN
jgi:exopolysaccharide biosynthesis polyprenyl glycosylphosphotransferase